jgi:hypothetical protein
MSETRPRPRILLDLSAQEFKTVIRALTGDLNRKAKKPEEPAEARTLGVRILDQYVRGEKDRLKYLSGVLDCLKQADEDVPEVVRADPTMPEVTILRPRSGITSSAGSVLVRRSER